MLLTYRQAEMTMRALRRLAACTEARFETLVWDNGSGDGSTGLIAAEFPGVRVHGHDENLGVAGGRNAAGRLAIKLWSPHYLMFLDNDIEVDPAFVSALAAPLERDSTLAQTQAKLLYADDPTRINYGGGVRIVWWRGITQPEGCGQPDKGQFDVERPVQACGGGAMMVRASVFEELGGFDERYNPFGPEDLDFSLRLREAGYQNLYVPTAVGYHAETHTFGAGYTEEYAASKVKHWFRLLRRHGTREQRWGFYLVGGPLSVLTIAWRETRRGNFRAAIAGVRSAVRVILQR
ncbi:MAG: glycosyltransferase family 2 protein [Gemmatimonadota bacterium]